MVKVKSEKAFDTPAVEPQDMALAIAQEAEAAVGGLMAEVKKFAVITTAQQDAVAIDFCKAIKAKAKEINDKRDELVRPLNNHVDKINAMFKPQLVLLKNAEQSLKDSHTVFYLAQVKKADDEKKAAEKAAADEQARLKKAAEKSAEKAEAKGDVAKAEAIREAVPVVAAAAPATVVPKIAGTSVKTTWKGEVVDKLAFVKAVAAGTIELDAVEPVQKFIDKAADVMHENLDTKWPGCRARKSTSVAVGI